MEKKRVLLVGDNPFLGISHLSQERAIARGKNLTDPVYAAGLVRTALENGADGFMFSVSNVALSILRQIRNGEKSGNIQLYAIAPYVFEFVRMAVTEGGIPGLAKKVGREVILSVNFGAIFQGAKGVIANDPASLLKAYLLFEESRIRSAAGKNASLKSIFLHEVVTDVAVSLKMEWLFRAHIEAMESRGIKPGFHTHALPYLVNRLNEWKIDTGKLAITTQFNSLGFGMCPSREECEKALKTIKDTEMIAYGVLASGYLKIPEATEYIKKLPDVSGIAIGVSKENQAIESFKLMRESFAND
jgi:hypothetical protein